ncbi:MAG: hypothetical protein ACK56F_25410, partial [bacterium]
MQFFVSAELSVDNLAQTGFRFSPVSFHAPWSVQSGLEKEETVPCASLLEAPCVLHVVLLQEDVHAGIIGEVRSLYKGNRHVSTRLLQVRMCTIKSHRYLP